ncbi:MAG: helix-turn-helix transcriptional regulator [Bacteroidetes bacterium]|nr:helix-turn-helix transcriptional regulator [Bacteroidota bacterium]
MSKLITGKATEITSCYMGPAISPEQFISEHFFLYLSRGTLIGYDGYKKYTLKPGGYCIVRKNRLARYNKQKDEGQFEKVVVAFDQSFLKYYADKYKLASQKKSPEGAFVLLKQDPFVPHFIQSLVPYFKGKDRIDTAFSDIKREELLMILLHSNPILAGILFDFREPQKIDLEAFMNKNYKFNVGLDRFAYLTGRSISAFKRDFAAIFQETPSRWLVQRRLQEARFLIEKGEKPSDIYLDLGFEDLSHFSYAFRKKYGATPTKVQEQKRSSRKPADR